MYNPDKECEKLNTKIKEICKLRGITPYALAKEAGIATSSIYSIMSGKTTPRIVTLFILCNALDLDIQDIFEMNIRNADDTMWLSEEEKELVNCYRYLPETKKRHFKQYLDMLRQCYVEISEIE